MKGIIEPKSIAAEDHDNYSKTKQKQKMIIAVSLDHNPSHTSFLCMVDQSTNHYHKALYVTVQNNKVIIRF